ncbi:hypothetical protein F5880DRAFT_1525884 [Lentinula raphanica]|nr:hypothetical protein F5880DRAFT_1525884 [Lentinula raphanica]
MPRYLIPVGPTVESMSRQRRNAVDLTAVTTKSQTASIGRRNAVDYTASLSKSDWWHVERDHVLIPRHNYGGHISVPFASLEARLVGVAMSELLNSQDLVHSSIPIASCLLPNVCGWAPRGPFVMLNVNWPGYNHLQISKPLYFFSPDGTPRTLMEVARDIASIYRAFVHEHHGAFNPAEHGAVRLGPNHVTFGHLRLLEIHFGYVSTSGGHEHWVADVSYATNSL